MSEIERRNPQEVAQQNGPISEMLENFPVEELDSAEMEVFTSAKAHVQELEAMARSKGIELGDVAENKESDGPRYQVKLQDWVLTEGYQKGQRTGYVSVVVQDTQTEHPLTDGKNREVWTSKINEKKPFSNSRLVRKIKKANKLADKLNDGLIK